MFFINNVYDELGLLDVFCRLIVAVLLGGLVGVCLLYTSDAADE